MQDIFVNRDIIIPHQEIELTAIRSQGAGGQHVNKVASGIHLRFDIRNSSLPEDVKNKLLTISDQRITKEGTLVIKSQQSRSQEKNRQNAIATLVSIIQNILVEPRKRHKTKPSKASQEKRVTRKKLRGKTKELRQKVNPKNL